MKQNTIKSDYLDDQELLIVETTAQMKMNNQKVEGRLILTGKRLIFIRNLTNLVTEIPLSKVVSVKVSRLWGVFNEGIRLSLDTKMLVFRVEYPMDWLKLIKLQMQEQKLKRELKYSLDL